MSLEATAGVPLDSFPKKDFSDPGERIPNMQEVDQETDNWCWAASVESVLATCCAPTHRRQRKIVTDFLPCEATGCQSLSPSKECNQRIPQSRLEQLWHDEDFPQARYREETVDFETIKKEIRNGRPVQVDLGHQHVVLIYGWEVLADGQRRVYIVDTHESRKPHASFDSLDNYPTTGRWGKWAGTVLGIAHS